MLAHCKELMEYQTGVFGAVERGQMLERVCKRELIDSMSRFAWNNNLRRSSKLVIIYLAFLGAVSAVGFIFLWNATDSIVINDDTGKTSSTIETFYMEFVQMVPDSTETGLSTMYELVISFFISPLFWLLIGGFGLVASQISYTYFKVDKRRTQRYEILSKNLEKFDRTMEERFPDEDLRQYYDEIEQIERDILGRKKDLQTLKTNLDNTSQLRAKKIEGDVEELESKRDERKESLERIEVAQEAAREKELNNLRNSLRELRS
ncbi:MAG: hypothetical protein WBL67_14580 [Nitrososphaeraceae archaeon]